MSLHFFKLFKKNFCEFLFASGDKQNQVIAYLITHINTDNTVCCTYRQIADQMPFSEDTVGNIMRKLIKVNFMKKINTGVYMINPAIIMKGRDDRWYSLMDMYNRY